MEITEDATVTSKGQVTIPKPIRERLDVEAGQEVEFVMAEEGEVTVRPKRPAMERLRAVRERLAPLEVDVEQLRRESRDAWSSLDDA